MQDTSTQASEHREQRYTGAAHQPSNYSRSRNEGSRAGIEGRVFALATHNTLTTPESQAAFLTQESLFPLLFLSVAFLAATFSLQLELRSAARLPPLTRSPVARSCLAIRADSRPPLACALTHTLSSRFAFFPSSAFIDFARMTASGSLAPDAAPHGRTLG